MATRRLLVQVFSPPPHVDLCIRLGSKCLLYSLNHLSDVLVVSVLGRRVLLAVSVPPWPLPSKCQ